MQVPYAVAFGAPLPHGVVLERGALAKVAKNIGVNESLHNFDTIETRAKVRKVWCK
jgi:hypothetical protein